MGAHTEVKFLDHRIILFIVRSHHVNFRRDSPILGREDPLGKEMATHSSILAWEIPWTKEPGGLQSMESQRV